MSRLIWICIQAVFIGGLTYAVFLDHPDKPMELAFAAFGAVVFCAFLTAALTRAWDSARFQLSRAIVWLVSILGVSGAITGAAWAFGNTGDEWPVMLIMLSLVVAMVSPIAVSIFNGLSPKGRKTGGKKERLSAAGVCLGERLEHKNRLRIGENPR